MPGVLDGMRSWHIHPGRFFPDFLHLAKETFQLGIVHLNFAPKAWFALGSHRGPTGSSLLPSVRQGEETLFYLNYLRVFLICMRDNPKGYISESFVGGFPMAFN